MHLKATVDARVLQRVVQQRRWIIGATTQPCSQITHQWRINQAIRRLLQACCKPSVLERTQRPVVRSPSGKGKRGADARRTRADDDGIEDLHRLRIVVT